MNSHHAYLIFADSLETSSVPEIYKTQSVDVMHIVNERFSIDDARELSRLAEQRSFGGGKRVFVIQTNDIAIEAQNALLKLFEEPPADALFYIVLKKTAFLLPTLRSRLFEEESEEQSSVADTNDAFESFMSQTYADRISVIAEKTKEKDPKWIEDILRGSEEWSVSSPKTRAQLLRTVVFVREYTGFKGSSFKMLLEELALTLPSE